jgi:magnesium transporter
MIVVRRGTEQGMERITDLADGCWVHLIDPGVDEIARMSQEFGIPADFFTYPLDLDESPRIEKENGALLIVLRVPHVQGPQADIPFSTMPLGIILTERVIATVCKLSSDLVEEFANGRPRSLSTTKRNRFFLRLFLETAKRYLRDLREINRQVDLLEDRLQMSLRNREVLELLKYQKSLTLFTTALKANQLMMARMQKGQAFRMYEEDEDLLEDVLTEIGQAIQMTDISSGILSQMMDAFASIISNNLNVVMKFLASATIILALPTLVASVYGMNIELPLQEHPFSFEIVMGGALLVALTVVVIFIRRDWL